MAVGAGIPVKRVALEGTPVELAALAGDSVEEVAVAVDSEVGAGNPTLSNMLDSSAIGPFPEGETRLPTCNESAQDGGILDKGDALLLEA